MLNFFQRTVQTAVTLLISLSSIFLFYSFPYFLFFFVLLIAEQMTGTPHLHCLHCCDQLSLDNINVTIYVQAELATIISCLHFMNILCSCIV